MKMAYRDGQVVDLSWWYFFKLYCTSHFWPDAFWIRTPLFSIQRSSGFLRSGWHFTFVPRRWSLRLNEGETFYRYSLDFRKLVDA
ncbi:MAG TPA: hypothetical protein VI386_17855 [Candidatus Sulfotelmatobacter sp.]